MRIRQRSITRCRWILALIVFACVPADAHGQCMMFETTEELFAHSQIVFRGTVISTESTGAQGFHQIVQIATFRVEQSWKGDPAREVRVGADRRFEKRREYLVFAAGEPATTSLLCRWTEPVRAAKPKLDWLSKHKEPSPKLNLLARGESPGWFSRGQFSAIADGGYVGRVFKPALSGYLQDNRWSDRSGGRSWALTSLAGGRSH